MKRLPALLLLPPLLLLLACGGGGGGSAATGGTGPPRGPTPLSAGAHTLGVSITMAAAAKVPASGLSVILQLPPGVTVATAAGDPSPLAAGALSAGSALTGTILLNGTYAAATRQAKLFLAHTPTTAWSGQAMKLVFTVPSGSSVLETDLQSLNATPSGFKVVGVDTTTHSTVVLTPQATLTLKVLD